MKKTKLKIWLNNSWEDLFPETSAELVRTNKGSGTTLDIWLQDFSNTIGALTGQIQSVEKTANDALTLALGASVAKVFNDYKSMIAQLNVASAEDFVTGQNFLIRTLNVPDIWVYTKSDTYIPFEYTMDEEFVAQLQNTVQVGWYILSPLETQKVNLSEYVKFTDYATISKAGVVKVNSANGVQCDNGYLKIAFATKAMIDAKSSNRHPIVTEFLDYAWKVGATTNTEEWTDEDKTKACETIGAVPIVKEQSGVQRVYGVHTNGAQQMFIIDKTLSGAQENRLPLRGFNGKIYIPTNSIDEDEVAVNKKFVEDGFVAKSTEVTTRPQVYVKAASGTQQMVLLSTDASANAVPMYNAHGRLSCTDPTSDYNTVNKRYVDSLPDNLALTDDTQEEDGTVTEGTKTKWQNWLGINSGAGGGTTWYRHRYYVLYFSGDTNRGYVEFFTTTNENLCKMETFGDGSSGYNINLVDLSNKIDMRFKLKSNAAENFIAMNIQQTYFDNYMFVYCTAAANLATATVIGFTGEYEINEL